MGFGAEVEEQARSFGQLQMVLLLAIVLVYAVMAAQFESLRDPFIIILSIPLAGIGIVGSLLLTGTPFSIQAYMGVIVLGVDWSSTTPSSSSTTRTSCGDGMGWPSVRRSSWPVGPGCVRS